jgi:hypothetical protein
MGKIIKTPNDIFLKFALFLKKDGKMISYVEKKDLNIFELSKVIEESHSLVMSLLDKLPYRGRILSRTDNRVTVNLGTKDGVKTNQILTVTQVIRLIRHPKFHFIVSAEKEIIGKIKLVQVNETLSFAKIISEKEYGAIQRDAKISGIKFVYYADEDDGFGGKKSLVDVIKKRTDSEVAFGADPKAWVPQKPPTFGKISGTFQFGNFEYARSSSSKSYKSDNYFPGVDINIEIWLTPKWSLHGLLGFGIGNLENPLSGSNPDSLSTNYSHYEMLLGYNIRMGDSIWGSKLEVMFGLTQSKYNLDSSLPISLTTSEYRGGVLGFYAHHPLKVWANTFVGGNLFYTVFPEVKEYPSNSGYGKNIDSFRFSIFGFKKVNEHFQYDAGIRFLMHANKYDKESTAKNLSVKYTSAFIGASYLF